MSNEMPDIEALDRLENRVLEMVEQLREAKRKLGEAAQETTRLHEKLREAEDRTRAAESDRSGAQAGQDEIRRRIEALIGRIESMEE